VDFATVFEIPCSTSAGASSTLTASCLSMPLPTPEAKSVSVSPTFVPALRRRSRHPPYTRQTTRLTPEQV